MIRSLLQALRKEGFFFACAQRNCVLCAFLCALTCVRARVMLGDSPHARTTLLVRMSACTCVRACVRVCVRMRIRASKFF